MPQPTGVADLHPTIFGFPTLKGLLTDPMAPAYVLWFLTSLGLLQHSYDLLLGEPALLQISSSIQHILLGGLSFHMVLFPGGTSMGLLITGCKEVGTVSCSNCGYTELYRMDGGGAGNILDIGCGAASVQLHKMFRNRV